MKIFRTVVKSTYNFILSITDYSNRKYINMPTQFQDKWLLKKDCNETKIGDWAEKVEGNEGKYRCFCKICRKTFGIEKGFDRVNQHAKGKTHILNLSKLTSQLILTTDQASNKNQEDISKKNSSNKLKKSASLNKSINTESACIEQTNLISLFNPKEGVSKSELLWCLQLINCKFSCNSCYGLNELFHAMFPCDITDQFSLSAAKAAYMITDGLYPYYKDLLIKDVQQENIFYTYQFDETGNVKNKKELQSRLIYWSNSEEKIVNRHLQTKFIARGDAKTIFDELLATLKENGLILQNILTLAKDGPNVNKKIHTLFENELAMKKCKIIDIGSCYIHLVHNAFLKGLDYFSLEISDFIIKVYYYFKKSDLRWSIYESIQHLKKVKKHKFIKHVSTRWLTIGPAADRMYEQLPALEEYFLKYIPSKEHATMEKKAI